MLFDLRGEGSNSVVQIFSGLLIRQLIHFREDFPKLESALERLRVSIDKPVWNRFGFIVENGQSLTLRNWVSTLPPDAPAQANRYFATVQRAPENWNCTREEFYSQILPLYDGVPHAWTHHEELKANFLKLSAEIQVLRMNEVAEYLNASTDPGIRAFFKKHRVSMGLMHLKTRETPKSEARIFTEVEQAELIKRLQSYIDEMKAFDPNTIPNLQFLIEQIESASKTDIELNKDDKTWIICKLIGLDMKTAQLTQFLLYLEGLSRKADLYVKQDIEYGDKTDPKFLDLLKRLSAEIKQTFTQTW